MTSKICAQCVLIPPTTLPQARLELLMKLSADGASDLRVKTIVAGLVSMLAERLGRPPSREELAQWLADAVHLLVDYAPDPAGEEVFQSVLWSLGGECGRDLSPITGARKGCGDCEDLASLLVAFCMVVGFRARVVWMEQPGSPLNHVSAQVWLDAAQPDGWAWLDATLPGARLGENPYAALARLGPDFRSRVFGFESTAAFAPAGIVPSRIRTNIASRMMTGIGSSSGSGPSYSHAGGAASHLATNPLRLVISHMPPYGKVFLGETRVSDTGGTWVDSNSWAVRLPIDVADTAREVRVLPAEGPARHQRVSIGATGDTVVDYLTMTPDATPDAVLDVLPLRLVISSMPPYGKVFLGDVRLSDTGGTWVNATTWALPLPADVASSAREVRVVTRDNIARHQRVSIAANGDQLLDFTAMTEEPVVKEPVVKEPVVKEPVVRTTIAVTGVPLTDATPGAIPLENGSVWVVEISSRSGSNTPVALTKQADGTTFLTGAVPGLFDVYAYRSSTSTGQSVRTDTRTLPNGFTIHEGPNVVPFASLSPPVEYIGPEQTLGGASLRVTGISAGWQVSLSGAFAGSVKSCTSTDACTAVVPAGGGVVRIALTRNGNPTVLASRVISVPPDGTEVDVAWDIRRAEQFSAGHDGLVSCDASGLRCGYLSDVSMYANEQGKFLTDLQARRTVKEFERLTPLDANGRAVYAIFVRGHGMTAMRASVGEAERLARDVAWLSTGKADANGYLPFELNLSIPNGMRAGNP